MGTTASTTVWTADPADPGRPLDDFLATPLARTLGLGDGPRMITAVGAGGKTTTLRSLGDALAARGVRVALTTTTHLAYEDGMAVTLGEALARLRRPGLVAAGAPTVPGKVAGFGPDGLEELRAAADVVLVEGDGSRRMPFKVPAEHEPVVPEATDVLLVVAGLSALGRPLAEACFRLDEARAILGGVPEDAILDAAAAATLLRAGYLDHPALARWSQRRLVVLNQADDEHRRALGRDLAALLGGEHVILTANPQTAPHGVLTEAKEGPSA